MALYSTIIGPGYSIAICSVNFMPNDGLNQRGESRKMKNVPGLSRVWLKALLCGLFYNKEVFTMALRHTYIDHQL